MLPKEQRIRKTSEFKRIFRDGQVAFSDVFVFKYLKSELGVTRFGIVISTKVSKKAVKRNKLKRQISEILRELQPQLEQGYDITVLVKKGMGDTFTFAELKKQLVSLCKKARLFKREKKHG